MVEYLERGEDIITISCFRCRRKEVFLYALPICSFIGKIQMEYKLLHWTRFAVYPLKVNRTRSSNVLTAFTKLLTTCLDKRTNMTR